MEEGGFAVVDEVEVQDLSGVPDSDKTVLPPSKGVLGLITRATINESKDGTLKALSLGIQLTGGIEVDDPEQGTATKFVNSYVDHGWMTFCYWATPEKLAGSAWYKAGKHMIGFKQLVKALDLPLQGLKVNDEFLESVKGKQIRFDVVQEEDSVKDAEGNRQKTGSFSNKIRNIKKAE